MPEIVFVALVLAGVGACAYLAYQQRTRSARLRSAIKATSAARRAGGGSGIAGRSTGMANEGEVTTEQKKRALSQAVVNAVAQGGRVESQTDEQAIIAYEGPNIPMYLFLTVITIGVYWLGGWLFYRPKKTRRQILQIDDYGNTLVTDL